MNKSIILLSIFILIISSCCSDNKQIVKSVIDVSNNIEKVDSTESKVDIEELSGLWINKKYYSNIIKYKDPKTFQEISELSFLDINERDKTVMIVWNFHEDLSFDIIRQDENFYIEDDKLTILGNELLYERDTLIKLEVNKDYNNILNELIFKGQYLNINDTIVFHANGFVEGLDSIGYYQPIIDYIDAGMQVNQIYLRKDNNSVGFDDSETFGFKFIEDTLLILELNCKQFEQDRCVIVEFGEIKYRLIKQK